MRLRWSYIIFCSVVVSLVWLSSGYAADLEKAQSLFHAGDYDEAIELATGLDNAEGWTLAAEILSAKVMLGYVEDSQDAAKQARKWATKAIKLSPQSQEAQVQYALAYGFETRSSSPFRAWRKKLPQKTHAVIETFRTRFPDDPRGQALLGAWHLGIIRKIGDKKGQNWFGASEADGVHFYEMALKAAPDDIVMLSNYAVTLLSLDPVLYQARAGECLTHIVNVRAHHAVEADMQARMAELMNNLDDPDEVEIIITRLLDGEDINTSSGKLSTDR